jgi:hypothetical protein
VELIGAGESAGNYREIEIKDGKVELTVVPLIAPDDQQYAQLEQPGSRPGCFV